MIRQPSPNQSRIAWGGITRVPATIVAATASSASVPSQVRYTVEADSSVPDQIGMFDATPHDRIIPSVDSSGQPIDESTLPQIIPARVGDACEIWYVAGQLQLRNVPEKINMGPCQQ